MMMRELKTDELEAQSSAEVWWVYESSGVS